MVAFVSAEDPLENRCRDLIDLGADMVGSLAGSAAGFLLAGPPGAFAGAAGGPVLKYTLKELAGEFLSRSLGRREKKRVGAVLLFAADKVREKLGQGQAVRDDGFLQRQSDGRTPAEEVVEGVILAAQRDHEEKKLRFYGNLIASLAFARDVDRGYANLLVRTAQQLSYRQLCLMDLAGLMQLTGGQLPLRQENYRNALQAVTPAAIPVLFEAYDLYTRGLVNCGNDALLGVADVVPAKLRLQGPGAVMFNLMELRFIDSEDVNPLVAVLS
jgi:hypothetical protein